MRLRGKKRYGVIMLILVNSFFALVTNVAAQKIKQDSVFFLANKKGLLGKIGKSLSVTISSDNNPLDSAIKNANEFEPYKGKIIRKITIEKLGFNKEVNDTGKLHKSFFVELGNRLHTKTRERIILNNLFFTVGDSLYPNLLADNEKLLRDLRFLQDARIVIDNSTNNKDSIDVIIICKDVFPIGGSLSEGSADILAFELNDDNILGSGNRIQFQHLIDRQRNPNYAFGLELLKRNIAGSFVNIAVGFQQQKPTINTGRREERSLYIRGELPLVSPYHAFTGGLEISANKTDNTYSSDSLYKLLYRYSYYNVDVWLGYSLGAKKRLQQNFETRKRNILSVRTINRDFITKPDTLKTLYDSRFTDLAGMLFSYTLFEQDFYHTNFIYGFGRNEDIPEGFNLSFTSGWSNQEDFARLYVGFDYQRNYFNRKRNYLNYNIKAGGYVYKNRMEDVALLTSIDYITRLRKVGARNWFVRHFLSGSFTYQRYIRFNDPLRLSSTYGIPRIRNAAEDVSARITTNAESVFYNTWKFVGFSFAPFVFTNISYLKLSGLNLLKGDIYTAVGGGIRTRNENLIFGTIELKAYYYPRISDNMNVWNVTISTDLRFRYETQLIKRPDFVVVN